jgi:hypothetical protein
MATEAELERAIESLRKVQEKAGVHTSLIQQASLL